MADLPEWTEVHAPPLFVLRASAPWASPAITTWLFDGSTASANSAARGWLGSDGSATQVESGSAAAAAPEVASPMTQSPTIVARRREPGSDTNVRIITQSAVRGLLPTIRWCYPGEPAN